MAKQEKSKADAPNADTIWSFLWGVEKDFEISRYGNETGLALREMANQIVELDEQYEKRVKELKQTDKKLLELDKKSDELKAEMKAKSVAMLKRVEKIRRKINVRGVTAKVLEEVQALEEELSNSK